MSRVQNLLKWSEQFTNAYWVQVNINLTPNTADTLDPLGGTNATKLVDTVDGASVSHRFSGPETGTLVECVYTSAMYCKAGTKIFAGISTDGGTGAVIFNLSTLATTVPTPAGILSYGMIPVGNGWYRCWVTYTRVANTGGYNPLWYICNTGTAVNYQGDGTGTMYMFGAQDALCSGLPEYVQTTSVAIDTGAVRRIAMRGQNLLRYSQQLDNALWALTNCVMTGNTADTLDPIGSNTASKMTDTVDGGAVQHRIRIPQTGLTTFPLTAYTASIYAKAGTNSVVGIGPDGHTSIVSFNLTTQVITPIITTGLLATSMTPVGNGWFRCSVTYLKAIAASFGSNFDPPFGMMQADGTYSYQGNGTGTMYFWGAQEVQANWPGPYTQTISVVVNNGSIRNLNRQPQNLILRSEDFNTGWTKEAGTVVTVDQTANPVDGTVNADLIDLTATAGGAGIYAFYPSAGVVTLDIPLRGAWFCKSIWLKGFVGGEIVKLTTPSNATGNFTLCTLTTSWQRFSLIERAPDDYTIGTTDAGGIWLQKSSGNKFYAWGAQFSRTNYVPDYVKTTTAVIAPAQGVRYQAT